MEKNNDKKQIKKKFDEKDVIKHYDEGTDDKPLRDTFRNVLDSNLTGEPEDRE